MAETAAAGPGPSAPLAPNEESERKAAAILQEIVDSGATVFFEKALTNSDAAGSGRVVIPKAIAEAYFPRLEQPSGVAVEALDTRGHEYRFKFRFWTNNSSRMYLLEGAGELHRQFNMTVGDIMVFAQKEDKTLIVAGRPATEGDARKKKPPKTGKPKPAPAGQDVKPRRKRARTAPEVVVDGVFRAVPGGYTHTEPSKVSRAPDQSWVVTLNLGGEAYAAVFDTFEDAREAFHAAGELATLPGEEAFDDPSAVASADLDTAELVDGDAMEAELPAPAVTPAPQAAEGGTGLQTGQAGGSAPSGSAHAVVSAPAGVVDVQEGAGPAL